MRLAQFESKRVDGRSNAQVVIDFVKNEVPGTLFEYAALVDALNVGSEKTHGIEEVRQAVAACIPRLLAEHQRRLHNVRMLGYRLAPASEHMAIARRDKRRADVQLKRGLHTLRNVRWDELDPNTRQAHEGHLMITESIYANQLALDQRVRRIEEAIKGLK